jgi:hypothetical protein
VAKYPARNTITVDRLLICESAADEAFFRKLITVRQLPQFCIRNPEDGGQAGGNTQFDLFLMAIAPWVGFENLKHIVIATDNDDANSFNAVASLIARAKPKATPAIKYGVPTKPLERAGGTPATVSVLMVPGDEHGNLEHLCLRALDPNDLVCVNQFAQCSGADAWRTNKKSKMKLQSYFASKHEDNPGITLGNVMRDVPNLIPLAHPCFDHIADFLRGF